MKAILKFILIAALLTACSPARIPALPPDSSTSNVPANPWQVVAIQDVSQNVMAAGFLTQDYGVTAGTAPGIMFTTWDGGQHWYEGTNQSDCRYGLDIVDTRIGWTSGGAMNVRRSTDSGAHWLPVTDYGLGTTQPFHAISFLDDTTGWIASLYMFGATQDGGTTWSDVPVPPGANDIASILLVAPATGYVLDFSGSLYYTQDNGSKWLSLSQIQLDGLVIPKAAYQMAAMRFYDRLHGLIVVSEEYQHGQIKAFHTTNGGHTWASELVPAISGPVFLSRQVPLLTILNGADRLTVLRYNGQ